MTDEKLNEIIVRCVVSLVVATIFIALLMAALKFGWVEKTASLGDFFTFLSIVSAGVLVYLGWQVVEGREKAERERIARAECAIFYRRYFSVSTSIALVLTKIFIKPKKIIPNLSKADAQLDSNKLLHHFLSVKNIMSEGLKDIPNMIEAYEQLSKVYQCNDEWGDLMSRIITNCNGIGRRQEFYENVDGLKLHNEFSRKPEQPLMHYYATLSVLTALLRDFEKIRRVSPSCEFESPLQADVMNELQESYWNMFPADFISDMPGTDPDAFLDFVSTARTEFYDKAQHFQKALIKKRHSREDVLNQGSYG